MIEKIDKHILKNGMVILGEQMEGVQSAAFNFMMPAGAAVMPDGCCGAANIIEDWIFRGAGDRTSRELSDAMDGLGLHRGSSVSSSHITIGSALKADNLSDALSLYADVILRPSLLDDQFELAKQLSLDGLSALNDDPRQKVMLELRKRFYPDPLGRSSAGETSELKAMTTEKVAEIIKTKLDPSKMIFSVAGKYDFDFLTNQLENLFASKVQQLPALAETGAVKCGYTHVHNDGAQVHIGLMTKTVKLSDEDYYNARVAVSVLSGGMSARLFTEVREKRGLCYAVGASYNCLKEAAGVMCYAGTVPEKSQETLDVIIAEFARLGDGIEEEEIQNAKAGLKSSLILQSESSASRAAGIGGDYYMLGRVRSLDEIKEGIERCSVDSVLDFLSRNRLENFTIVTIGPKEVNVS